MRYSRPAGQSGGSDNLSAIVATDRAFPAAVAEMVVDITMHTAQLHVPASAKRFRWPVVIILSLVTGCLPFTVSGMPEFCAIVVLPFCLGFLISRWWTDSITRVSLALALPLLGLLTRLLSSLLHNGSNWFVRLFRAAGDVGISDPYVRQMFVTLLFPVAVTAVATVLFMIFPRRDHCKDA